MPLGKLIKNEDGGITPFGLYFGVATMMIGGLAVDGAGLVSTRTQLQVAADLAAHAAIMTREFETADQARAKALELVEASFPKAIDGDLLRSEDIHFGYFDSTTGGFQVDENSNVAVMVETQRLSEHANPLSTHLLRLVGVGEIDVMAAAVFSGEVDPCLRDGWVAEGMVDAQSNNLFKDGFCVHSNDYVSFNQNNVFEPGVNVSMPDLANLSIPASGFAKNSGLQEALAQGYMNIRILDKMDSIFAALADPTSDFYKSYLHSAWPVTLTGSSFETSDFKKNRINQISCGTLAALDTDPLETDFAARDIFDHLTDVTSIAAGGNGNGNGNGGGNGNGNNGGGNSGGGTTTGGGAAGKITIDASGTILKNVVIYTDCAIKFANGSALENVVIYSTNTGDKAITASQGLRLGADDFCSPDGGVQIMTQGGFEVAAKLEIYSSQVIAQGPIQFAAQGDGVEGGSFISGTTIDGTSLTDMSACPAAGMEENFAVKNFQMAG